MSPFYPATAGNRLNGRIQSVQNAPQIYTRLDTDGDGDKLGNKEKPDTRRDLDATPT